MNRNIFTFVLLDICVGLLLLSPTLQGAGIIKAPQDPASPEKYSISSPEWRIADVFGPRNPGANVPPGATIFHLGIDYNQQQGDADFGIPIKALAAGTIEEISRKPGGLIYISIRSAFGSLQYLHIFRDSSSYKNKISIDNGNIRSYDYNYSKIVLTKISNIVNSIDTTKNFLNTLITCNAIYFYNHDGGIKKILTTTQCANSIIIDPKDNSFVSASSTVNIGEHIAPLGRSNATNAHLHLAFNHNKDNPLTIIEHPESEKEKIKFTLATESGSFDVYNDTVLQTMTKPGFVIKVEDSNLRPDLNQVIVSLPDKTLTEFNFGGGEMDKIINANIDLRMQLNVGADKPTIKPILWPGMKIPPDPKKPEKLQDPRIMYFFVPYPKMKELPAADYILKVHAQTVTGKDVSPEGLKFKIDSALRETVICNLGPGIGSYDSERNYSERIFTVNFAVEGFEEFTLTYRTPKNGDFPAEECECKRLYLDDLKHYHIYINSLLSLGKDRDGQPYAIPPLYFHSPYPLTTDLYITAANHAYAFNDDQGNWNLSLILHADLDSATPYCKSITYK